MPTTVSNGKERPPSTRWCLDKPLQVHSHCSALFLPRSMPSKTQRQKSGGYNKITSLHSPLKTIPCPVTKFTWKTTNENLRQKTVYTLEKSLISYFEQFYETSTWWYFLLIHFMVKFFPRLKGSRIIGDAKNSKKIWSSHSCLSVVFSFYLKKNKK